MDHINRGPLTSADFRHLADLAAARCCEHFLDSGDRSEREAETYDALVAQAGSLLFWEQLSRYQARLEAERLEGQRQGDKAVAAFATAWLAGGGSDA